MRLSKTKIDLGYSIVYKVVSMIVPLVTSPYLSRTLGPGKIGEFQYIASIAYYFFYFAMLGVNDYGNREIARSRESRDKLSDAFWQIYYMQFFLTIVSVVIYAIVIQTLLKDYWLIGMLSGLYVLSAAIDINWLLYGCEKIKECTVIFSVQKIVILVSIFMFVKQPSDLWKYTLIVYGYLVLFTLLFWLTVKKEVDFRKPDFNRLLMHIKPNIILFLPIIASSVYNQMDKIMMGWSRSDEEIGFYSLAENIINIFTSVTIAVNSVMLPKNSRLIEQGESDKGLLLLYKSTYFVNALNVLIIGGTLCISKYLVPWYLGNEYIESAKLLNILVPTVFLIGLSSIVRSQYLIPQREDSTYLISIIGGAIVNFSLNLIIIPKWGAKGASVTTILAYATVLLIQCVLTRKSIRYGRIVIDLIPFVFIGLLMCWIMNWVPVSNSAIVTILAKGMIGVGIYTVLSVLWYMFKIRYNRRVKTKQ